MSFGAPDNGIGGSRFEIKMKRSRQGRERKFFHRQCVRTSTRETSHIELCNETSWERG